jgi:hypothetical protein
VVGQLVTVSVLQGLVVQHGRPWHTQSVGVWDGLEVLKQVQGAILQSIDSACTTSCSHPGRPFATAHLAFQLSFDNAYKLDLGSMGLAFLDQRSTRDWGHQHQTVPHQLHQGESQGQGGSASNSIIIWVSAKPPKTRDRCVEELDVSVEKCVPAWRYVLTRIGVATETVLI